MKTIAFIFLNFLVALLFWVAAERFGVQQLPVFIALILAQVLGALQFAFWVLP